MLPLALFADRVSIVANFDLAEMPLQRTQVLQAGFDIEVRYPVPNPKDPSLKRAIVMNNCLDLPDLIHIPKDKLVHFFWEPYKLDPAYYQWFSRVYTWDDSLVDGVKFFKLYYPHLKPMRSHLPPFESKKFCTLVASNWTPARLQMVEFFSAKPEGEFEFYGKTPDFLATSKMYKGTIPGTHSGPQKYNVLKDYKFCICFENTPLYRGYITEKIFGCFAAGCVPVYWGATNVEQYIPKECYIDYRDFKTKEELYRFMKVMTKEQYEGYLASIRKFIQSEQAQVFSPAHFDETFYRAVVCD